MLTFAHLHLIEIFVLMVLTFLLTRRRVIPDMVARAPDRHVAWRKTILVLGYHAVAPHVIVDTPLVVKIFGIA
jgi:hypothetical protein